MGMKKKRTRRPKVSDQVRRAIKDCGLTRYRIYKETGIDQASLSKFLSGERGLSLEALDKLGELLHLEVVTHGAGDVVQPEHLPPKAAALASKMSQSASSGGRLAQVERATILAALAECDGNRTHAAEKLGISRRALIYKLRAIEAESQ
jgi:hypothetical protein